MKPEIKQHPIQVGVSGQSIPLTSFSYENGPGSSVYLQGNLHGPEIFGTALLIKLIQYIKDHGILSGKLTVVPQANPFGVQSQTYGLIHGRWNPQTGNNWNRIFSKPNGDSIEAVLARTLINVAEDHDIVLDIHTSGIEAIPHLYVSQGASNEFNALGCAYHILYNESDYCGAFDETLWKIGKENEKKVSAATWEASSHVTLYEDDLESRLKDLLRFLASLGMVGEKSDDGIQSKSISMQQAQWLSSPRAGYITWIKEVGEYIKAGEVYVNIYEPWSGNIEHLIAQFDMVILSKGTLQAVSSGQEIGKIMVL